MDPSNNSSTTLASINSLNAASPIGWGPAHPYNETEQIRTTNRTRSLFLQWADEQFDSHAQHYLDQEDDDGRLSYILSWNRMRSPLELQRRLRIWLKDRYTFYSHYFGGAKYLAEEVLKALVQARDCVATKDDARLAIHHALDMNKARNIALRREHDRLNRDAEFLVQSLIEQSVYPYSEEDVLDALHNAHDSLDCTFEVQIAVALQLIDGSTDYETTLINQYRLIAQYDPVESITVAERMWVDLLGEAHNDDSLQTWRTWAAIVTSSATRMKDRYDISTEDDSEGLKKEGSTSRDSDESMKDSRNSSGEKSQSSLHDDGTDADSSEWEMSYADPGRKYENRQSPSLSDRDIEEWREEYKDLRRWTRKKVLPTIPENEELCIIDGGPMLRAGSSLQEDRHPEEYELAHVQGLGSSQGLPRSSSTVSEIRTSQAGESCYTNSKRSSKENEPNMEHKDFSGIGRVLEHHSPEFKDGSSPEEEYYSAEEDTAVQRDYSPVGFGSQRDHLSTSRHLLQHNGALSSRSIHFEW